MPCWGSCWRCSCSRSWRPASAQFLSPGPLSAAHASLEGDTHCSDCHSSGKRVDQGACLKCHGDIGARIAAGKGLHGLQYSRQGVRGVPRRARGRRRPDALAGRRPELARPRARPAGRSTARTRRRPAASATTTATRAARQPSSALPTACASCHKDVHDGPAGHQLPGLPQRGRWKQLRPQDLQPRPVALPLRGAHQTVACAKCHPEPPKYTGLKFQACTDCHKDPHAGPLGSRVRGLPRG